MTDPLTAARALIEPLTGYTPGPWRKHGDGKQIISSDTIIAPRVLGRVKANTRLIAAAPDLRDMVATLADALEAERAEVAAAYEAAALVMDDHGDGAVTGALGTQICCSGHHCGCRGASVGDYLQYLIRALTPADAQAALDKMLAEARLAGWRAGRDAAAELADTFAEGCFCEAEDSRAAERFETASYFDIRESAAKDIALTIRALPEPKEASHV